MSIVESALLTAGWHTCCLLVYYHQSDTTEIWQNLTKNLGIWASPKLPLSRQDLFGVLFIFFLINILIDLIGIKDPTNLGRGWFHIFFFLGDGFPLIDGAALVSVGEWERCVVVVIRYAWGQYLLHCCHQREDTAALEEKCLSITHIHFKRASLNWTRYKTYLLWWWCWYWEFHLQTIWSICRKVENKGNSWADTSPYLPQLNITHIFTLLTLRSVHSAQTWGYI